MIAMGNMTKDPELRMMPNGTKVVQFSIAVSKKVRNNQTGQTNEYTEFLEWKCYGAKADVISQHFHKGSAIMCEGEQKTDKWQDNQTGQNRTKTHYVLKEFSFCGGRNQGGGQQGGYQQQQQPTQQQGGYQQQPPQQGNYQNQGGYQQNQGGYQQQPPRQQLPTPQPIAEIDDDVPF